MSALAGDGLGRGETAPPPPSLLSREGIIVRVDVLLSVCGNLAGLWSLVYSQHLDANVSPSISSNRMLQ